MEHPTTAETQHEQDYTIDRDMNTTGEKLHEKTLYDIYSRDFFQLELTDI